MTQDIGSSKTKGPLIRAFFMCPRSINRGQLRFGVFLFVKSLTTLESWPILQSHTGDAAMKYLAEVHIKNIYTGKFDQGTYVKSSDSLDEIRTWAKSIGKPGDELFIVKNGDKLANGRTFTL